MNMSLPKNLFTLFGLLSFSFFLCHFAHTLVLLDNGGLIRLQCLPFTHYLVLFSTLRAGSQQTKPQFPQPE